MLNHHFLGIYFYGEMYLVLQPPNRQMNLNAHNGVFVNSQIFGRPL